MDLLRIYLLLGLVSHKVLWELFKRRRHGSEMLRSGSLSLRQRLIKAAKIGILISIVAQTLMLDVLPIAPEPFGIRIVGIVIYTVGLLVAMIGRVQLSDNWSDIEAAQVLDRQVVVSHGLYRYIRHPIYIGDLLLLIGLELSLNSWLVIAVGLMAPVVLWQAIREERMLVKALPGYDLYCSETKRFIPFLV